MTHPSTLVRTAAVLLLVASASLAHAADRAPARTSRHAAKKASATARATCAPCPACPAGAASTACRTTSTAATLAAPAPAAAGMVVGLDPETGVLGAPTAAQRLELSPLEKQMISRSMDGLYEKAVPGGGFGIDLQGRFQEFSFVRIGSGGRLVFDCQNDAELLRRILATPVQPALEDR